MLPERKGGRLNTKNYLSMDDEEKIEESVVAEEKKSTKLTFWEKLLAGFSLLVFLFVFYVTLDANKYEAQVRVIDGDGRVGVNPTDERLDFGDLSRGTAAVRMVTVKNDAFMPFFVSVLRFGTIGNLMDLEPNHFMLRRGEEKKIEFTAYMPASAEIDRVYTGRVFVFKIPAPFL